MEYQDYDETWENPIEGLSEEELELRAARYVRQLRKQRDELLAACKAALKTLEAVGLEGGNTYEALQAAIAKAKGESQ